MLRAWLVGWEPHQKVSREVAAISHETRFPSGAGYFE